MSNNIQKRFGLVNSIIHQQKGVSYHMFLKETLRKNPTRHRERSDRLKYMFKIGEGKRMKLPCSNTFCGSLMHPYMLF
jgi:hypothetical protein